ncbi:DNA cross-link repair protein PSO2 [Aspergillus clavatus NRRL 1]|uniref:DNA repair protein Pso2/Snm1, putative n=1 Tax=Aspergillus clavatus (strain ATCC 1007 / CBS 513.65 / DSM 816 / NCTC 3887 / NRRL 1 / QM 1276 / 107) TaxID=344612 RepID=A1C7L2_ASPCL|nr:DNA repair protein Pso2/Snm1, putative [Aspergillus clavatus NRRL 1]EAW14383.1 DNA repair protein Pso2/Snm1, putative [Aspergillus clavatus NRRL 1]
MAGFQTRKGTPSKTPVPKQKPPVKRNASLLSFFQKADGPPQATSRQPRITQFVTKIERTNGSGNSPLSLSRQNSSQASNGAGSLFLEDKNGSKLSKDHTFTSEARETRSRTPDDIWEDDGEGASLPTDVERYNENGDSVKRRRRDSPPAADTGYTELNASSGSRSPKSTKTRQISGPFIDESDTEDDLSAFKEVDEEISGLERKAFETSKGDSPTSVDAAPAFREPPTAITAPSLVREATSHAEVDEFPDFDDIENDNFLDEADTLDPFGGGEDNYEEPGLGPGLISDYPALDACEEPPNGEGPTCPICEKSLLGLNEADIMVHVNDCLDGKPTTVPENQLDATTPPLTRIDRAAIPRPAQRDPYSSGPSKSKSAFSKIMAGNAEDAAWATAAAGEVASRGKQAYQRTCPFYKIIPGFSICVDAFRYGAVEGCNAYFLSHYHSDHYIGLTASWRHGPIYCSRATANLVRQQLKVNGRWLVDLEFEKKTEVPGTNDVQVTMIEANHCPGSAIFLFEKSIGSGSSARVQRILHCGDFRASPTHVQHSLLRPDIDDPITGERRQQKIDVCYLDTTYMSPKYAFPSQEDVIEACASLCVSLDQNPEEGVGQSLWQKGSTGAGNVMNKFFSAVSGSRPAQNPSSRPQGRLLVVIGTYSIGKERICLGIARALKSKIYATPAKKRVCACLEDADLSALLTDDPTEAQVHMQTLFEIRAETLADYLDSMKPHFSRVVGFRPTGWTYRPPAGRMLDNPPVSTVLHSPHWKTPFSSRDLVPQRGSTRESACYGVPYSEHSSFRELTMFCCALRIGRVIPTVNVGSRKSRERMKAWIDRWDAEKRKSGLYRVEGDRW